MSDAIAHTAGELIEVRCTLPGCPMPLIGVYLPELYAPGSEAPASERHLWTHHILPRRMQEFEDAANAQPFSLEGLAPGISAVMAEHRLQFTWEKP